MTSLSILVETREGLRLLFLLEKKWRWYFMQIGYKNNGKITGYGLNASSSHKLLPPRPPHTKSLLLLASSPSSSSHQLPPLPHTKFLLLFLLTSIPSSPHKLLLPPPRPYTKFLLLVLIILLQIPPSPHINFLLLILTLILSFSSFPSQ